MAKLIGGLIVVGVLVVGVFVWQGQRAAAPAVSQEAALLSDNAPESMLEKGLGAVASIKDAMGLGKSMRCSYTMDQGGKPIQATVWVDGEKFKTVTQVDGMEVNGIFDGANQYSWTSAAKVGMKMSKECMEKMMKNAEDLAAVSGPAGGTMPRMEDFKAGFDMAKNVSCEAAGTVDLTLPKDITFTDQCAMMQDSMKMMQEMKDKLPAGMEMPKLPNAAAY